MSIRLAVLAGARPNFMKVAPLMAAFARDQNFETILIHTGQHYDGINEPPFGLVTLHRPANVDDKGKLSEIVHALRDISEELPLYWPVHPRTRASLSNSTLNLSTTIRLLDPLSYFDFFHMQAKSGTIFTDSGAIQEESTVLGITCFTLLENTERPATIDHGTNRLAGTSKEFILDAWEKTRNTSKTCSIPPLWDGNAGSRSHEAIKRFYAGRGSEQ